MDANDKYKRPVEIDRNAPRAHDLEKAARPFAGGSARLRSEANNKTLDLISRHLGNAAAERADRFGSELTALLQKHLTLGIGYCSFDLVNGGNQELRIGYPELRKNLEGYVYNHALEQLEKQACEAIAEQAIDAFGANQP